MMMSDSHRRLLETHGTLVGRALMGLLFFFSGVGILMNGAEGIAGVAGMISSVGLPAAELLAYLVIVLKLIAGGALIVGFRVGWAAAGLIGFTLLTVIFFHRDMQDPGLWKNLAVIGGLLYVMAYGPGAGWSLGSKGHAAPASE